MKKKAGLVMVLIIAVFSSASMANSKQLAKHMRLSEIGLFGLKINLKKAVDAGEISKKNFLCVDKTDRYYL